MTQRPDVDALSGEELKNEVGIEILKSCGFKWYKLSSGRATLFPEAYAGGILDECDESYGREHFTDIFNDYAKYYDLVINEAHKEFRSFNLNVVGTKITAKFDFERVVVDFKEGDDLQKAIGTAICRAFLKWKWRNG